MKKSMQTYVQIIKIDCMWLHYRHGKRNCCIFKLNQRRRKIERIIIDNILFLVNKLCKEGWEIEVKQNIQSAVIRRESKRVLDNLIAVERQNNRIQGCQAIRTWGSNVLDKWQIWPSVQCSLAFSLEEFVEFLSSTR